MPSQNNKNDKQKPRIGTLRRLADLVQGNMDDIYKSTYYADPNNRDQLNAIKTDITASIKDIMDVNSDNIGEPNISRLYERLLLNSQNDSDTVQEFERIFGDNEFINSLTSSYLDNRWVKAIDDEINEVMKYMPKLQEALSTIKDNVLSSDSFSKDYLNLESQIAPTKHSQEQFARNINDMKERYDMLKLTSDIYDKASTYGEVFVYCVPYTKAISRLMDRKKSNNLRNISVKTNLESNQILIESSVFEFEPISFDNINVVDKKDNQLNSDINFNIQIERGIISSVVESEHEARQKRLIVKEQSLTEQFMHELATMQDYDSEIINEGIDSIDGNGKAYAFDNTMNHDLELGAKLPVHHKFDKTLHDDMELPNQDDTTVDGLYNSNKRSSKINNMNGCIVKILKRERVVPIILNDICLGYYYFDIDDQSAFFDERQSSTTGVVNTITGLRSNGRSEAFDSMQRREELLRNVANSLAEKIDTSFVNANQDLKKEIYYILKYNDSFNAAAGSTNNIRVSYIPPEDIHHIYFDLDEDTGRGTSDLNLSLIPAKLWVAIYITNCLAVMTRGNDKRVYYVRQSVESNISKTLLKTINEIKKSNFGIRQIENINSVLNITGRFNDYIIPRGNDGQSPIEFEVMPGQQIEIKTDLLNLLEESAINVIGVPIEIIQNRQSPDYALQLTMSNSKFLRFVYTRQGVFQKAIAPLYTKIYDIEYGTNDQIIVTLPPPLFINVTNTNQLITNTSDYCDNITNIVMADEQDDVVKAKFSKELKIYYLGSYLNMDVINQIMNKARQSKIEDYVSNPENLA
jgi:hypothetical protein